MSVVLVSINDMCHVNLLLYDMLSGGKVATSLSRSVCDTPLEFELSWFIVASK